MLLISDSLIERLNEAVTQKDDNSLVETLEQIYSLNLDSKYSLVLGVVSMMPPFADYHRALEVFSSLFDKGFRKEASIWAGYLYSHVYPLDNSFAEILTSYPRCSISNYVLAVYFSFERNVEKAKEHIELSIENGLFPNNILFKLSHSPNLNNVEREKLTLYLKGLISDKHLEDSSNPRNIEELYSDYWDELILGKLMTSVVWEINQ